MARNNEKKGLGYWEAILYQNGCENEDICQNIHPWNSVFVVNITPVHGGLPDMNTCAIWSQLAPLPPSSASQSSLALVHGYKVVCKRYHWYCCFCISPIQILKFQFLPCKMCISGIFELIYLASGKMRMKMTLTMTLTPTRTSWDVGTFCQMIIVAFGCLLHFCSVIYYE